MLTGKDQAFKNLRKKTRDVGRAFIIEVDRKLAKATPVLFGVARANWLPSVDSPDARKIGYPNKQKRTYGTQARASSHAFEDGARFYLSNNLPYIRKLNEGGTKKVEPGFVENSIRAASNKIKRLYK
jgi:hypothetical protein